MHSKNNISDNILNSTSLCVNKLKSISKMDYPNEKQTNEKNTNKQWPQWLATVIASLSFITAGICFSWSSPSLPILQSDESPFPVSNDEAAWIASCLSIGCAIGPIVGSLLSRILGPKYATIVSAIPYLTGFVLIIIAKSPEWLYVSRFISGFAVGFGQTATPIYVAEIAENKNRGALLSFFTFSMGVGSLFIIFIGPYMTIPVMAEIASIFPVTFFILMLFMPDSPYYLVRINKNEEAAKSLRWLRRQKNENVIQEEMCIVEKAACENVSILKGLKELLKKPNPKGLGIVNLTFAGQNVCGAIVIMFYQERIADISQIPLSPEICVMIISVVGNITGVLGILIVDRWGRKPLALVSAMGCSIATATLGTYLYLKDEGIVQGYSLISWVPFVAMMALNVSFAIGLSPVPSIQLGELFSSNVKEIAFCICSIFAALGGFVLTKLFQVVEDSYGLPVDFWSLSILTFIVFILMIIYVPETKGKNFLEIQDMLSNKEAKLEDVNTQKVNYIEKY